eukprot:gene2649-3846_t
MSVSNVSANIPDVVEELFDQPGDIKLTEEVSSKIKNASTFVISKEDHTLGNLIRMKLLDDKSVLFAGYRVPHPLTYSIEIKIQTKDHSTPRDAFENSLLGLQQDFQNLEQQFRRELK